MNCTSGRSRPATQLSWFINGDLANPDYLRHFETIVTGREGLETSTLGLRFKVKHKHFRKGDMKLKVSDSVDLRFFVRIPTPSSSSFRSLHSVWQRLHLCIGAATRRVWWGTGRRRRRSSHGNRCLPATVERIGFKVSTGTDR